jgi:hypothetical protein
MIYLIKIHRSDINDLVDNGCLLKNSNQIMFYLGRIIPVFVYEKYNICN